MSPNIEDQLVDFVQTVTTDTSIHAYTDLMLNNYLDSLLLMDLVIFVESETGITLTGDDVAPQNFRTMASLARMIDQKSTSMLFGRFAA